tara:strand:+ start:5587 stop:6072 length:486 start_codon:yes stop_codon:yes gene_type:complete
MNIEKFLHDEMCDWFINLYKKNDDKKTVFNEKKILKLYDLIKEEDNIKALISFIDNYTCKNMSEPFFIKNMEVVEWNEGQSMDWHRDYPYYKATSIIFLNDDYDGGELVTANDMEDSMKNTRKINKPKKGSIVSFSNMIYHRVNPVIKGKRYTLALWYDYL